MQRKAICKTGGMKWSILSVYLERKKNLVYSTAENPDTID